VVARSAHWTLSTVTRTGPAEAGSSSPPSERGRAQLAGRRGHHAKPPPACFLAGPGQQQRFPGARFAFDEQHPTLALLSAVQQAEDGLELRPRAPASGNPGQPRHPPNRSAVIRNCV